MESSEPDRDSKTSKNEQLQPLSEVVSSSTSTSMDICPRQSNGNCVVMESSDPSLQQIDGTSGQSAAETLNEVGNASTGTTSHASVPAEIGSHTSAHVEATSLATDLAGTASHASVHPGSTSSLQAGQLEPTADHDPQSPSVGDPSCPPGAVLLSTHPRAVEEGGVCVCLTPDRPSESADRTAPASASLQLESERPGPSGLPPTRPTARTAVDAGAVTGRPPLPPGRAATGERSPCCATSAQACHVLSLPDMRRPRASPEEVSTAAVARERPCPAAAAASSDPTAGQAPVPRPSVSSGIRVALQSVASHTSFASPLSSIGPFCRICHEGESREQLISPCRCAGSVGLVHVSCIEKWLSAANKDSCEICMYKYVTERRPKPLLEWLLNPSNPEDARNLVGDVICFFLLTALAVIAAYLCLMAVCAFAAGASHYLSYKTQWEATGLVVLGLLISSIYCVWLVVTCRYHCRVWQDWRRTHQDVHLLEMKRLSYSTVDLNNNTSAPAPPPAGPGCRACRGGSYSCSHCCAVCPVHGVQTEPAAAAVTAATAAVAAPAGGSDDVFAADTTTAGADRRAGTGGAICGAVTSPIEPPESTETDK
ncbi:uncharacterized protein LOC122392518 isoform X3 [Amphibalanus amphitrite]|nr:uncharacterized protein LOC122392518 isoform X3 [Amphibalanus amphitrite]XP_043243398.1 uncharacterized protein LOC122392518 isoform X3 [Amphibalanus amphitrite]XP_043243399.1 uncharacterized protein LOC122392518 isoform X3 [Amphibalanus amphitrite]XP_043243400.1 uncharacterized protein LOC122392518 isoform X3 [Amphibalanus amphitrite]